MAAARGVRADLWAGVLGALAAAALPPVHAIPVLLLSVPGLLGLIDAAPGMRAAARRGFWFGFGLYLAGLYWITEPILIEARDFWWLVPFAAPLVAFVLALFVAVPVALARIARAGWPRLCVLAGGWTLADLARQFVLTGFPWNPLGSVWAIPGRLGDVFIQPASLAGVHGLTLATLLLAGLPSLRRRRLACATGAALLAVWAGYGILRLDGPVPAAPALTAILVQGNVAEGEKWERARAIAQFRHYLELTASGVSRAGPGRLLVIWPETASPFLLQTDAAARAAIADAAGPHAVSLIGSVRFDDQARPRNSLMAITDAGPPASIYDKWHLVPFGEYQPDWFPLPFRIGPGEGFAAGDGPRTLHVQGLPPIGPLICYEAIFPGAIVQADDRPDLLVNITNDAWFGDSSGPRQHLAAARLRAVEEGLPLLRAANTGISAGFDAFGHELGRLGINRSGTLELAVPGTLKPTLFSHFGIVCSALLALTCSLTGFADILSRRERNRV